MTLTAPPSLDDVAAPATPGGPTVRGFLRIVWQRRLVALLMVLLVAVCVAAVLALSPHRYTAAARVAATPPAATTNSPANYTDLLGTAAEVAHSLPVLEEIHRSTPSRSVAQLQDEVNASVIFGTVLIQVDVSDTDPTLAAQIANAAAAALAAHNPSRAYLTFTRTQPATVPTSYASPDLRVVLLAGVLLALVLGAAGALAYDRLARTVDDADDLAASTGVPVLGVVPRPQDPGGTAALQPASAEFPALRALRVALEFACIERPTRSLVVAPAATDPWAGWLEVNLAVALAEVGHRVLLVDADRAAQSRHPVFDTVAHPGLYDIMAGTASLDAASLSGPIDGVSVVPLGNADLAAPSLLEMRFGAFLEEVDEKYDVILVNASPLSESDDARIMSVGGGLLLTVPVGRVQPRMLSAVMGSLRETRTRVLGSVVLGTRKRR